jgi:hypothetical protein
MTRPRRSRARVAPVARGGQSRVDDLALTSEIIVRSHRRAAYSTTGAARELAGRSRGLPGRAGELAERQLIQPAVAFGTQLSPCMSESWVITNRSLAVAPPC